MNAAQARDLYFKYCAAVAYVAVETPQGDAHVGTAFHVGENIWMTARHVIEGNRIQQVKTTEASISDYADRLQASGGVIWGHHCSPPGYYEVVGRPMLHPDAQVDIAALKLKGPLTADGDELPSGGQPTPIVQLGGWLDDWLGSELVLEPVVVMGYPPIPFGREPLLIATRAEINTVLDKRGERHPYFILSAMARGGFSGALALTSFENALGVAVESLVTDSEPAQLGYFAVLSVEPIFDCLAHHGVLPAAQEIPSVYETEAHKELDR